jgi:hypothetical protein
MDKVRADSPIAFINKPRIHKPSQSKADCFSEMRELHSH